MKRIDAITGSLVGFAIGDAMGATTEFMRATQIKDKYGKVTDIIGGGWLNLEAGEVTDDTQMMMQVAEACLRPDQDFLPACCQNFSGWLKSGPKDVGMACRAAIQDGEGKTPVQWMMLNMERQRASQPAYGNGSVMRALFPLLCNDLPKAIYQGRLTHDNAVCDQYIAKYGEALSTAMYQSSSIKGNLRYPMDPTGHVENSVMNAIFWFCRGKSFEECIVSAVNHGGDADTIAALTGGIAGAYWGIEGIPQRWIDQLNPQIYHELRSLAVEALGLTKV